MAGSLRRRLWGNVLFAFGLLVVLAAAVTWFLLPVQYEAFALVQVSRQQPSILQKPDTSPEAFAIFKRTQVQLVLSNVVLNDVLRDANINRLESVQEHAEDPVEWLRGQLMVSFPKEAEVMRISMKGTSPSDTVKIVDAVTSSYMEEIVEAEKAHRLDDEAQLRKAYEKHAADHTAQMKVLHSLAQIHGTPDSEQAQLKKRLATEELDGLLARRQGILRRIDQVDVEIAKAELVESQAKKPQTDKQEPSAPAEAAAEPKDEASPIPTPDEPPPAEAPRDTTPLELLGAEQVVLKSKLDSLSQEIAERVKHLSRMDSFSAEVAAKQQEVEQSRLMKNELGAKLDRLEIERLAPERIDVIDRAVLESSRGDAVTRYSLFGSLAVLGMALAGLGMVLLRPKR